MIDDRHSSPAPSDDAFIPKPLETAVHMNDGEPDRVGEFMLRQWDRERTAGGPLLRIKLRRHLHQEVRDSLQRMPLPHIQQPIPKNRSVPFVRKRQRLPNPRPLRYAAVQFGNPDDRHFRVGKEADGVIAAVQNDEIGVAHLARHQISKNLPLSVDQHFVAESYARYDDIHDRHARTFVHKRRVRREQSAMAAQMSEGVDLLR
jgi:hypothetical protein